MITTDLHLTRRDRANNIARYYQLNIASDLFGSTILLRRWGRIGTSGQLKAEVFNDDRQALATLLRLLRAKRAKGYIPSARLAICTTGL